MLLDYTKICKPEEAQDFVKQNTITNCIISSVRKETQEIATAMGFPNAHIVSHTSSLPIRILYDTPHTLGIDRITAAIGALSHYPNRNCLIVDMGTCNTIDVLNADKEFLGGNISPGWSMRLQAMDEMTSKLPLGEMITHERLIGKSTQMALENGAFYGMLFELEGYINALTTQFNEPVIVFTGGAANHFAEFIKTEIFVHPFLILDGLNHLNEHNS